MALGGHVSAPVRLYRLVAEYGVACYGPPVSCGDQICMCFERVSAWNFWHGVAIAGALAKAWADGDMCGYAEGYADGCRDMS
jgi:hypothetical protein